MGRWSAGTCLLALLAFSACDNDKLDEEMAFKLFGATGGGGRGENHDVSTGGAKWPDGTAEEENAREDIIEAERITFQARVTPIMTIGGEKPGVMVGLLDNATAKAHRSSRCPMPMAWCCLTTFRARWFLVWRASPLIRKREW